MARRGVDDWGREVAQFLGSIGNANKPKPKPLKKGAVSLKRGPSTTSYYRHKNKPR